ncbi:MAG: hypothetical protein GY816_17240 [Cytophagales bacterium]|nr:hypothetical protein [Cytophagales bacterium]
MEKHLELYWEEIENLKNYRTKLQTHTVYKDDLDEFGDQYEELVAQTKVITRVSDRLQKKLDSANLQIREQNDEIKDKNLELEGTVLLLAKAKVGQRAALIMMIIALCLFISEQLLLEPYIASHIDIPFAGTGILLILFFVIKGLESGLEKYFMNKEKQKIMKREQEEAKESLKK